MITWLQSYSHKQKEGSEHQREAVSDMTNRKWKSEIWHAAEIWSCKYYDPNDLEKQNQYY